MKTIKLVKFYSYIDGLKTGYTGDAMYCLTATGKKNGMRLISVVMGEESTDKRSTDTISMMEYGFSMYSIDTLVSKNDEVGNVLVNLGEKENVGVMPINDISILNNTQKDKRNVTYDLELSSVNAPVKKGDIIGKIIAYENGKIIDSVDVTVSEDINKANIFKILLRNMRDVFLVRI